MPWLYAPIASSEVFCPTSPSLPRFQILVRGNRTRRPTCAIFRPKSSDTLDEKIGALSHGIA